MKDIKIALAKIINFVTYDVWRIRLNNLSAGKSFLVKQLRIFLLVIRGFYEGKYQARASSLTFYSLLSIVPVLAMAFGIAKGFGFEKMLQTQLLEKFSGQEEVLIHVIKFANSLLENTKGGIIAGIGLSALFWTVIKVLGQIEHSFNEIWQIKKQRTPVRKISDYLSIMLISPAFVVMSGSVTVFIITRITHITEKISLLGFFSPVIFFFLKSIPFFLIWVLFTFIYIIMPNTRVSLKSGLLAGVLAGTLYQLLQWGYIDFQILIAKYNAIYGSFAALPLFLIWMQLSWLIVLLGAEISFVHQNADTYEFEQDCSHISASFKRLLSLQISHLLIKNFSKGEKPLIAAEIANTLEMPIRLALLILHELVESRIVSAININGDKDPSYQPACNINLLTVKYIIEALEQRGVDSIPVAQTDELKKLSETMKTFWKEIEMSSSNRLLKDL